MAAGGAVLALLAAIPPTQAAVAPAGSLDPVFNLIETHRTADAAHLVALAEQDRLALIGDPDADLVSEVPCYAAMDAFNNLIGTAPTTFAGLQAWACYLDEIRSAEGWMFEERGETLVATFVEALGNLTVTSEN